MLYSVVFDYLTVRLVIVLNSEIIGGYFRLLEAIRQLRTFATTTSGVVVSGLDWHRHLVLRTGYL